MNINAHVISILVNIANMHINRRGTYINLTGSRSTNAKIIHNTGLATKRQIGTKHSEALANQV